MTKCKKRDMYIFTRHEMISTQSKCDPNCEILNLTVIIKKKKITPPISCKAL